MSTCASRLAILALSAVINLPAQNSPAPADREAQWRQDVDFMTAGLKASGIRIAGGIATRGQKDFALLYPRFDADIESIKSDIPNLTDAEIYLRLTRLVASAHVGHNRIQISSETRFGVGMGSRLALTLHWFADGLAVVAATPPYSNALGARVVSLGDRQPEQLLRDLEPYMSYENEVELHAQAADFLTMRAVLQHFQLIGAGDRVAVQVEIPNGEPLTLSVTVGSLEKRTEIAAALHTPLPLYRSRTDSYYWSRYLEDSQTLYVQYNICENDPQQRFADFAKTVFSEADSHSVKRVVVDLRRNGGGNSRVIGPLKDGLAARSRQVGPVYVLIGPATFSSAVDNAEELRRNLAAKLVGETTGGMPGGYGEVSTLTPPNSKLVIRYTTKGSFGKAGAPNTLTPDIAAPITVADFAAGRDPGLDAAIRGH